MSMLQGVERASAKVEYRSEKFNSTIKESVIRLGDEKFALSFAGHLTSCTIMNETKPTQPASLCF